MNNIEAQPQTNLKIPSTLRLAIYFFIAYGCTVAINALYYIYWSGGDYSEFSRAAVRIFGVAIICYALFKKNKWGLWIGIGLSAIISLGALISIPSLYNTTSVLYSYPLVSKIILTLSGVFGLCSLIFLLHPKSRKY